jgi:hypothetical protein
MVDVRNEMFAIDVAYRGRALEADEFFNILPVS